MAYTNATITQEWIETVQQEYEHNPHIDDSFRDSLYETITSVQRNLRRFRHDQDLETTFCNMLALAIYRHRTQYESNEAVRQPADNCASTESLLEDEIPIDYSGAMDSSYVNYLQVQFREKLYSTQSNNLVAEPWSVECKKRLSSLMLWAYSGRGIKQLLQFLDDSQEQLYTSVEEERVHQLVNKSSSTDELVLFSLLAKGRKAIQTFHSLDLMTGIQAWVDLAHLGIEYTDWVHRWQVDAEINPSVPPTEKSPTCADQSTVLNAIYAKLDTTYENTTLDIEDTIKVARALSYLVQSLGWTVLFLLPPRRDTLDLLCECHFSLVETSVKLFQKICKPLWEPLQNIGAHVIVDIMNGNALPFISSQEIACVMDLHVLFAERYCLAEQPDCQSLRRSFIEEDIQNLIRDQTQGSTTRQYDPGEETVVPTDTILHVKGQEYLPEEGDRDFQQQYSAPNSEELDMAGDYLSVSAEDSGMGGDDDDMLSEASSMSHVQDLDEEIANLS